MSAAPAILVIDDEPQIRKLVGMTLEGAGYAVSLAASGEEGKREAAMRRPEAIVLDLGLPDMDGLEVLKGIREWSAVPILILSVRAAEEVIVAALDAGADDYLTKPFRGGELLARVRAALRRTAQGESGPVFTAGLLSVDLEARVVRRRGEIVKLTPIEYSLLALFVKHAGKVLTHKYILEQVWGPAFEGETQYTRVFVGQLRKKLEEDPSSPRLFLTESGIGYRLAAGEDTLPR